MSLFGVKHGSDNLGLLLSLGLEGQGETTSRTANSFVCDIENHTASAVSWFGDPENVALVLRFPFFPQPNHFLQTNRCPFYRPDTLVYIDVILAKPLVAPGANREEKLFSDFAASKETIVQLSTSLLKSLTDC